MKRNWEAQAKNDEIEQDQSIEDYISKLIPEGFFYEPRRHFPHKIVLMLWLPEGYTNDHKEVKDEAEFSKEFKWSLQHVIEELSEFNPTFQVQGGRGSTIVMVHPDKSTLESGGLIQ